MIKRRPRNAPKWMYRMLVFHVETGELMSDITTESISVCDCLIACWKDKKAYRIQFLDGLLADIKDVDPAQVFNRGK